jgi:hypothetical protein
MEISELEKPQSLSNTDRLRLHLSKDGLANALLDAWLADPTADAQKRMIDTINNFHDKKQAKNEQATVTEN